MSIRIDDVILDDDASKAALSGTSGNLRLGGNGVDGDVLLFPSEGDLSNNNSSTFHLDANGGNLWMGGNGKDGDLVIFPANASSNNDTGDATFHFDGDGGNLWMGGNGKDGDLVIFPANASNNHDTGDATFHFDGDGGNLWIGGNGTDGDISLFSSSVTDNHDTSEASIHLDANAGDITLRNTGVAEEFAIAESVDALLKNLKSRSQVSGIVAVRNPKESISTVRNIVITNLSKSGIDIIVTRTTGEVVYAGDAWQEGKIWKFMLRDIGLTSAPTTITGTISDKEIMFEVSSVNQRRINTGQKI